MTPTPPPSALVAPVGVQPHGVLLALDHELVIVMCSANTTDQLGVEVADVVGRPLAALVGTDVAARVGARRDDGFPTEPMVVVLGKPDVGCLGGQQVEVRVHASGSRTVVELEPVVLSVSPPQDSWVTRAAMTRLAAATDLADLTALLAEEVRELTDFDRVLVVRRDRDGTGVVLAAARRPDLEQPLGNRLATTGSATDPTTHDLTQVRFLADVTTPPVPLVPPLDPATGVPLDLGRASLVAAEPSEVERLVASGVTAVLTIAMMVDDQFWGSLVCHHYAGPHRPGHEVRSAAEFLAQVAAHLVSHRERADAREAAALTKIQLAQLTARLSSSEGPVIAALFADPGLLTVFGASGVANLFEGNLLSQGAVPDRGAMQDIADLLNVPDSYTSSTDNLAGLDPRFVSLSSLAEGVLRVGTLGDRWGLWFRSDGTRWEPWHIEAAEDLGRHVNSLLLLRSREQVAMAESMQRLVALDRAPTFAGVELVARYRPATTYQLGGDWWDAFELDERRLVFAVGDVAGHGVAAASAMTQVRTALRAYLYDGHGPAGSLDRLDHLMDGLLDIGIATALVAVLDRTTGKVEIANAGHPDPLLVKPDGTVSEVALGRRPLLGVGSGRAPLSQIDLADGAMLIFFTDGLVERRGLDIDQQTARLISLAAGGLSPSPLQDVATWSDRVLAELDTPDDDTTILAIRLA